MRSSDSLLEFPCDFPLKVMGLATADFPVLVRGIVDRHVVGLAADAVRATPSRQGKYVSLTVTVRAESQAQLDALYTELSAHERVLMVL
ncbi:MAG: YbeD family protein [Gammaproteobacteria bacterium]